MTLIRDFSNHPRKRDIVKAWEAGDRALALRLADEDGAPAYVTKAIDTAAAAGRDLPVTKPVVVSATPAPSAADAFEARLRAVYAADDTVNLASMRGWFLIAPEAAQRAVDGMTPIATRATTSTSTSTSSVAFEDFHAERDEGESTFERVLREVAQAEAEGGGRVARIDRDRADARRRIDDEQRAADAVVVMASANDAVFADFQASRGAA